MRRSCTTMYYLHPIKAAPLACCPRFFPALPTFRASDSPAPRSYAERLRVRAQVPNSGKGTLELLDEATHGLRTVDWGDDGATRPPLQLSIESDEKLDGYLRVKRRESSAYHSDVNPPGAHVCPVHLRSASVTVKISTCACASRSTTKAMHSISPPRYDPSEGRCAHRLLAST